MICSGSPSVTVVSVDFGQKLADYLLLAGHYDGMWGVNSISQSSAYSQYSIVSHEGS